MFRVSQHPSSGVLKTVTATSGIGLHRLYVVTMLCAIIYIKVKTGIKIEVCLFKYYVS